MTWSKVDQRVVSLIENNVKFRHRSMFVIIGDEQAYERIVDMHDFLCKSLPKSKPSVLWCYKEDLFLSSHKKKRGKQVKVLSRSGSFDHNRVTLFLDTTNITYCLYKDSEKILGNTFGMCILQDFESLTPNLLARTIETVEGGGLVLLLLRTLSSLTSLQTMVMDVHKRFRTESHSQTFGRFNERFLLSLASCKACIFMDDKLHILPISSHVKTPAQFSVPEDCKAELKDLKEQLSDDFPVGPLIRKCCTMDQGRALLSFMDAILDKSLQSTVALLAARGRGKSATLGLAISGAVAAGYSNIFVTAPSPENLKTLFEFVRQGFDVLKYKEHLDYDVIRSTDPDFKKATVRMNIYKQHRQTIQYIQPHEHQKLSQVELLVIDEAAAIPLPIVKSILGPYLVFLSSTVNGYEGTGRSLSLKLLKQLEEKHHTLSGSTESGTSGQLFKSIKLNESVRYASGDPIESWLNSLLYLDVTDNVPSISRLHPPSKCDLYYVNRDTLFSYHKDSELFLQRMVALFVASHYKNSPNDLQLMADAPAHHLFVLLGPVDESKNHLPDILCVIQICFEGQISRESVLTWLGCGRQPCGDQIPWKFCEQFRNTSFASLSGARIVRIATHPSAMRLGYGSAAVKLLARYFEGQLTTVSELDVEEVPNNIQSTIIEAAEKASLQEETIKPRSDLPPLLAPLRERRPEKLHYLGVSFGLTLDLFRFWRRHSFSPFYVGSVPVKINKVTGEYTCMVLRPLNNDDIEAGGDQLGFFSPFYQVFKKSFTMHLNRASRHMDYNLAMSILDPKIKFSDVCPTSSSSGESLSSIGELMPTFMEKLDAYINNLVDHHLIEEYLGDLARSYFWGKIPVSLSYTEASVLLSMGLQAKSISDIQKEMKSERNQILALFMKLMKKFNKYLKGIETKELHPHASRLNDIVMEPHPISVDEDLNDAAKQIQEKESMQDGLVDDGLPIKNIQQYAIVGKESDFDEALQSGGGEKVIARSSISIKSDRSVLQRHRKNMNNHRLSSKMKRIESGVSPKASRKRKSSTF
ncbi:hypothetical protein OROGR_000720 [Orobanche gracilis]